MSEESGLPYLDEEERLSVGPETEEADAVKAAAGPSASPSLPDDSPSLKAKRGGSRPLREEEVETLARIVESLGGVVSGRLKLRVQRRQRGQGWKTLRPITIEDWMIEDGLDVPEVVGESYGNGFYRWQLRYSGKFVRKGDCNLEGYDEIPDSELLPPDSEEEETVDLQELLGGFKQELLGELKPAPTAPDPADLARQAVETAMKPVLELIGALRGEMANLAAPKTPAPATLQSDPALQTLVGILSQQNSALFDLVKGVTRSPAPVREGSPRYTVKEFRDLLGITTQLRGNPPALQPHFVEEEEAEEPEADDPVVLGEPEPPAGKPVLDQLSGQLGGTFHRIIGNVLKYGEERLQKDMLGGSGDTGGGEAPAAGPSGSLSGALSPADRQNLEQLFETVGECVERGVTPEQFRDHILPQLPAEILAMLRSGEVGTEEIAQLARLLGQARITERLQNPEVRKFLGKTLALFRKPS